MKENIIRDKSYAFAIKIIDTYKIIKEKKEYELGRQLLKSGTSIGANIEEAIGGQSRKDFLSKMQISYKEARETQYWIKLLRDTGYLHIDHTQSLLTDLEEILRILGSIIKSIRNS